MSNYVAVVKKGFVPLASTDTDVEVVPGDYLAIMYGLQALLSSDARDNEREDSLWDKAEKRLIAQQEDENGPAAEGSVNVDDSFNMAGMGRDYGWGYGTWWGGDW